MQLFWHKYLESTYNIQMGDYFEGFIQDEARQMGKTLEQIQGWKCAFTYKLAEFVNHNLIDSYVIASFQPNVASPA